MLEPSPDLTYDEPSRVGAATPATPPLHLVAGPTIDARLKRELAHRRFYVSVLRRLVRQIGLHVLDGVLIAAALWGVSLALPGADFRPYALSVVGIWLLCLNATAAYLPGEGRRDRRRLLSGSALAVLILLCISIFPPRFPAAPIPLATLGVVAFLVLALGRKVVDLLVRQAYVHGLGLRRALLIGSLEEVSRAIQQLRDDRNVDQYIVGHLRPDHLPDPTALGAVSELERVLAEHDVQEVVLATSTSERPLNEIARKCFDGGVSLFVFPAVVARVDCRVEPLRVAGCPLLHLSPARIEVPAMLVKRSVDLLLAIVGLVVLSPVIAGIALAIKVDSPGPVFFRQRRVGLGGRHFTMWKFRSMVCDSEFRQHELAPFNAYADRRLFKLRLDPRTTRVGRFLRRSSLDELPQLINVVLGHMSLVGPRPPVPSEVAAYEPHHFVRLSVVPGITGPWQTGGRNLITDFETVVRLERAYIRSWSLLLDAKILMRTFKVVVSGEGAY